MNIYFSVEKTVKNVSVHVKCKKVSGVYIC